VQVPTEQDGCSPHENDNWAKEAESAVARARVVGTPAAWQEAADAAVVLSEMAKTMQAAADAKQTAERTAQAAQEAAEAAKTAAKTAATAKGAPAVGALESGEFSSLPSGNYVIYSGDYHSSAQAQKALAGVRAKFPGAKVIHVAGGAGGGAGGGKSAGAGGASGGGPPVHSSLSHPAPPSVLKSLKGKGKSYVEASKNLPDVVETG